MTVNLQGVTCDDAGREGNWLLWQAFFADIYAEAQKAAPARGHEALAAVACLGRLRRHYTLNIDGLAESVGLATWHPTDNPTGEHTLHAQYQIGKVGRLCTWVILQGKCGGCKKAFDGYRKRAHPL